MSLTAMMPSPSSSATTYTEALHEVAQFYGIELGYTDAFGSPQSTSDHAITLVLEAMGVTGLVSTEACKLHLQEARLKQWQKIVSPLTVVREGDACILRVQLDFMPKEPILFKIQEESGQTHSGQLFLTPMNKIDEAVFESSFLFFKRKHCYFAWEWQINLNFPQGYHQVEMTYQQEVLATCQIAKTPRTAYSPACIQNEQAWGYSTQVYSLKSSENYGMGDLQDLERLLKLTAEKAGQVLGVNPLHQLFPHNPKAISPYSPSSRLFLNWLYLRPQSHQEFTESHKAQALYEELRSEIERVQAEELVDYEAVASFKRPILEAMFEHFMQTHIKHENQRGKDFVNFVKEKGHALHRLALYEALCEDFNKRDASLWGWPVWNSDFQNANAPEVKQASIRLAPRTQFFMYLQFLLHEAMNRMNEYTKQSGMKIGLYMDLAVGTNLGSADVWANPELYSLRASVGCPPDVLNRLGQNWGLPPIKPFALQEQGFQPFIDLLRANMQYAGALRIDHALALFRTFWVPEGETGANGAYVKYPTHQMLGLIALESQRNQCVVIGEDLGTVPEWVRQTLMDWNIFSYRVFFFERGEGNSYLPPSEYPSQALVTISTHDLPTLQGYWLAKDIETTQHLGLFPTQETYENAKQARPQERQQLLDALIHNGFMPEGYSHNQADYPHTLPEAICKAVDTFLASCPSQIRLVQIEDALGLETQVNVPGTVDEHPNWKRKLSVDVDTLALRL